MTQNFSLSGVQSALGVYFKTPSLLSAAFTHISASDTENNESLIFLGERLLDFVIADYVCTRYTLSAGNQLGARLDSFKKVLNIKGFVSEKGVQKYINLSPAYENLREDKSLHEDVFLALLAAIYKDGGLPSLKAFILPLLRAIDSEDRYPPKKLALKEDAARDAAARAQSSAKPIQLADSKESVSKAENGDSSATKKTDTPEKMSKKKKSDNLSEEASDKPTKKGVSIFKAIIPSKKGKKDTVKEQESVTEAKPVEAQETKTAETPRRSFIRDALTPVSLPESMKNPKPKKPFIPVEQNNSAPDSENYKSLLQEHIQKNIRSASVLIKYNTTTLINGSFVTEVTLDGRPLAKGEGSVKKSSEKAAAKAAYEQITDGKSPLYSWFTSLTAQGIAQEKTPDNYVSRLNEYYQKKSHSSAAPLTYEPRPSGEKKTFSVAVMFNGEELAVGSGHTVKDAKQDAAKRVCEKLKI